MFKISYSLAFIFLLITSLCSFSQDNVCFLDELKEGVVLNVKSPIIVKANKKDKSLTKIHSTAPPYFLGTIIFSGKANEIPREIPIGETFTIKNVDQKFEGGKILNTQNLTLYLDGKNGEKIDISILVNQPFEKFLKRDDARMKSMERSFLKYFEINKIQETPLGVSEP